MMPNHCQECGGEFPAGETCEDRHNQTQLQELEDRERYAVHHLAIPAYMLQHNRYSERGWLETRALLARFVAGLDPQVARRQFQHEVDSGNRTFSFTRGPKLPGVEDIRWSFTMADVRSDTAANYCEDVRTWAASVLTDSEDLAHANPLPGGR